MSLRLKFKQTAQSAICQGCSKSGHHIYECKNPRSYVSRPSVSKRLLEKPQAELTPMPSTQTSMSGGNGSLKRSGETSIDSNVKKRKIVPDSPEFKSKHDDDTVDLSTARNFRSLVEALREHLVSSKSTRLSYVSMAKNIHMELPHDIQLVTTPPNDDDFLSFLKSDWPTFRSRRARKNKIRWGYVQKGEGKSHTIRILSSIVESAESANAVRNVTTILPLQVYNLTLMAIILRELAHAFTKTWFMLTPGIGKDVGSGEAGLLVEKIMGGRLTVEWDEVNDFGKMDNIDRLLLINNSGGFEIDGDRARDTLSSLRKGIFHPPAQDRTMKRQPSLYGVRARITETTYAPVLYPYSLGDR